MPNRYLVHRNGHGRVIWTDALIEHIRQLRAGGMTMLTISKELGTPISTMKHYASGPAAARTRTAQQMLLERREREARLGEAKRASLEAIQAERREAALVEADTVDDEEEAAWSRPHFPPDPRRLPCGCGPSHRCDRAEVLAMAYKALPAGTTQWAVERQKYLRHVSGEERR